MPPLSSLVTRLHLACATWFSNLSKTLKLRIQASQNKCVRFCLQLGKRSKIRVKEFLQTGKTFMMDTYNSFQFIAFDIFKFQNDQCFDELLCSIGENGVIKRFSNKRLKLPFQKTKLGIQSLSYVGPNTWNSLSNNLKSATNVNSFIII